MFVGYMGYDQKNLGFLTRGDLALATINGKFIKLTKSVPLHSEPEYD